MQPHGKTDRAALQLQVIRTPISQGLSASGVVPFSTPSFTRVENEGTDPDQAQAVLLDANFLIRREGFGIATRTQSGFP
jgi:hypothetical protein